MKTIALRSCGFVAALAFATAPLMMVLGISVRQVSGPWYATAVAFSVCVLSWVAWLLRVQAKEVARGIAWSLLPFLGLSAVLWSLVQLPAH